MKASKFALWLLAVCVMVLAVACKDDSDDASFSQKEYVYNVAVCFSPDRAAEWQRTAAWAEQLMKEAQDYNDKSVRLSLEWIDTAAPDFVDKMKRIADDERYAAVIGPADAALASTVASLCLPTHKTLLLPETSNAEFQRIFANKDNIFCLTQNELMQAEVIFSLFRNDNFTAAGAPASVALIASGDSYGDTFRQWFGYLATEKYMKTDYVGILGSRLPVETAIRQWNEAGKDADEYSQYLFFASTDANDLLRADAELTRIRKEEGDSPLFMLFNRMFCTGMPVSDRLAAQIDNTYEGLEVAPNPSSAFAVCYKAKFGVEPLAGEAQFFDALFLLHYSLIAMNAHGDTLFKDSVDYIGQPARHSTLWQYVVKVVDGRDPAPHGWLPGSVGYVVDELWDGKWPDVEGVSSDLTFDSRYHCAVIHSVYRHWRIHNGRCVTLQYLSADGSDRTVSSIEEWSTQVQVIQELLNEDVGISYPARTGNYAVIVAASSGWSNYRHQADALAMYRLLRQQGYDDDHIILIMEDDIAYNKHNLYPGVVKVTPDGDNLYEGPLDIDYKMSSLGLYDLQNILCGDPTSHTPVVLDSSSGDNVFVFWSGHGDTDVLNYGKHLFTAMHLQGIITRMKEKGMFRKLFFVIEACFSGSVAEYCEGTEGVLFMTAANNAESSKADMKDPQLNVWLSNGFTRAFQSKVTENPTVSLRDLFYHVATQTVGSHAGIYNHSKYGNVYTESMWEYMVLNQAE